MQGWAATTRRRVRTLPGHGNVGRKRKEIMASTNNGECVNKILDWIAWSE